MGEDSSVLYCFFMEKENLVCSLSLGHSNFQGVGPGSLMRTELGTENRKEETKHLPVSPAPTIYCRETSLETWRLSVILSRS